MGILVDGEGMTRVRALVLYSGATWRTMACCSGGGDHEGRCYSNRQQDVTAMVAPAAMQGGDADGGTTAEAWRLKCT